MATFETGKTYYFMNHFDGDTNVCKYKVIKRTKCFITFEGRRRKKVRNGIRGEVVDAILGYHIILAEDEFKPHYTIEYDGYGRCESVNKNEEELPTNMITITDLDMIDKEVEEAKEKLGELLTKKQEMWDKYSKQKK
jgi:hypothetical protein